MAFTFIFDIGKTNIKGYVINDNGNIEWSKGIANTTQHSVPYPHFDIAAIESWLISALTEANQRFILTAINISTHGACAVLIDKHGKLALPVLDYEYEAISKNDADYISIRPPFSETQSPALSAGLNLGRQLWWQKTHFSAEFSQTKHVLMYPQFWAWKLSGVMVNDRTSLGCHTDLWSPVNEDYSLLVTELGLVEAMPPLVQSHQCLGTILPEIATKTAISKTCKVFAGVHDSNASFARFLGPLKDQAFNVVSTGTWIITMCSTGNANRLDEKLDMLANVSVNGTAIPCARFMGGREFDTLLKTYPSPSHEISIETVTNEIKLGNKVLPSFAPASGPFQGKKGKVEGNINSTPALATLYLALCINHELNLLDAQGDVIFGSMGTKNPTLLRLLAQLRPQQRILSSNEETGTVMGAWLLTRWDQAERYGLEFKVFEPAGIEGLEKYAAQWLA